MAGYFAPGHFSLGIFVVDNYQITPLLDTKEYFSDIYAHEFQSPVPFNYLSFG